MPNEPTPLGQSAVTAGQARVRPKPEDEAPRHVERKPPVDGPTPVGETVQTAPPKRPEAAPRSVEQLRQSARNLALLARQAIGNGWETMSAVPHQIADLCVLVEGVREASTDWAEERQRLLQRIAELEADPRLHAPMGSVASPAHEGGSFTGPGQRG
jgi:hypothetical protein